MTIVSDVLVSLALGLGLALLITFEPAIRAFRPSQSEVRQFERAAALLARSRRLQRDGYLWLTPGLVLIGLRRLPGGVLETLGWGLAIIGYLMITASIAKLVQWRFPPRQGGPVN